MKLHRSLFPVLLLTLVAALTIPGNAQAAGEGWIVDFEAAKKEAASGDKDILMDFTGSDWCGFCIKLKNNVFSKDVFKSTAPKHFVLVMVDFPNDKSHQSAEEIKQNERLKEEYPVGGFPTIFLADAVGRPYARLVGYGGDAADAYTKNLVELTDIRKTRDANFKKAAEASGTEKAKLLDKALDEIDSELVLAFYGDQMEQIIKLDPKDEAGLKSKYEQKVILGKVNARMAEIRAASRRAQPAEVVKMIDDMIADLKPKGEALQQALFNKGALLYRSDKAASKTAFEASLEAAPDSNQADRIRTILERAFAE